MGGGRRDHLMGEEVERRRRRRNWGRGEERLGG